MSTPISHRLSPLATMATDLLQMLLPCSLKSKRPKFTIEHEAKVSSISFVPHSTFRNTSRRNNETAQYQSSMRGATSSIYTYTIILDLFRTIIPALDYNYNCTKLLGYINIFSYPRKCVGNSKYSGAVTKAINYEFRSNSFGTRNTIQVVWTGRPRVCLRSIRI